MMLCSKNLKTAKTCLCEIFADPQLTSINDAAIHLSMYSRCLCKDALTNTEAPKLKL